MEIQYLFRWHAVCGGLRGPFKYAEVIVMRRTRTAGLVLNSGGNPETGDSTIGCSAISSIGEDDRPYAQIGQDIIDIARQHSLVDANTEVKIHETPQ